MNAWLMFYSLMLPGLVQKSHAKRCFIPVSISSRFQVVQSYSSIGTATAFKISLGLLQNGLLQKPSLKMNRSFTIYLIAVRIRKSCFSQM